MKRTADGQALHFHQKQKTKSPTPESKPMLTPQFTIQQENDFLILNLKVPFIKSNSVEISINEFEFKFYSKPYFLRYFFMNTILQI